MDGETKVDLFFTVLVCSSLMFCAATCDDYNKARDAKAKDAQIACVKLHTPGECARFIRGF